MKGYLLDTSTCVAIFSSIGAVASLAGYMAGVCAFFMPILFVLPAAFETRV